MLAEGAGRITRDLREAFLGHDLKSVSRRYNLGKKWGEDVLRDARAAYRRAETFLSTSSTRGAYDDALDRAFRIMAAMNGVSEDALKGVDFAGKTDEEIVTLLKKLGAAPAREERPSEKAVAVGEVPRLLDDGWTFVSTLNGSMAVLRAPTQVPIAAVPEIARPSVT